MNDQPSRQLALLARLYGVQTSYWNIFGQHCFTPPEAVLAVLRALGAPVSDPADVPDAIRQRRLELWRRVTGPVLVSWTGEESAVTLRVPADHNEILIGAELSLESGGERRWEHSFDSLPHTGSAQLEGSRYVAARLPIPGDIPVGYHRLKIELAGTQVSPLLISAPRRLSTEPAWANQRCWGVFMPLYALHSGGGWGVGDLGDLRDLMQWVSGLGGSFVGVLPLLSSFYAAGNNPSPYAPISRFFWNELFLDITAIPGFEEGGGEASNGTSFAKHETALVQTDADYVDYHRVVQNKREVIKGLADRYFSRAGDLESDAAGVGFSRFVEEKKYLKEYAGFMAASERYDQHWSEWPVRMCEGDLRESDYEQNDYLYHLFLQWQLSNQLGSLVSPGEKEGAVLYLDFPVGVPHHSFDVWQFRDLFLPGFSVGAPPDTFFRKGQSWGFPPLNPDRLRHDEYGYFIEGIRNHLRYAGILRLDHIMSLHRLYWIPEGFDATDGAYVRSRTEELYAVLLVEAARSGAVVVGEDLGTVPRAVRRRMKKHGVLGMYVLQSELKHDPPGVPGTIGENHLASLNTHDMPLLAAFWQDEDTELLLELGHLDEGTAAEITEERELQRRALSKYLRDKGWLGREVGDLAAVTDACHNHLAASSAPAVIVSLEDLWQENRPQNVPGTTGELPNWCRRSRYSLEEIKGMKRVGDSLREIDRLRKEQI